MLVLRVREKPDAAALAAVLDEKDQRILFEALFEQALEHTWEEAESCLEFLRNRRISEELAALDRQLQSPLPQEDLLRLLARKDELRRELSQQKQAARSAVAP